MTTPRVSLAELMSVIANPPRNVIVDGQYYTLLDYPGRRAITVLSGDLGTDQGDSLETVLEAARQTGETPRLFVLVVPTDSPLMTLYQSAELPRVRVQFDGNAQFLNSLRWSFSLIAVEGEEANRAHLQTYINM